MAAAVDAHCTCARDDVEPKNGRCARCGKLLRETFDTQAVNNVGVARHSPSAAYRSPIAPFDLSKSVAAAAGLSVSEQGAEPEAAPPTPLPSPQLNGQAVASAPAPAGMTASRHDSTDQLRAAPQAAVAAVAAVPPPAGATDPTPPPDLSRVKLPRSGPSRKWIETTRALHDGLVASAAAAEKRAAACAEKKAALLAQIEANVAEQLAAYKAEAVRLRNAARAIGQVLEQVGIEAEAKSTAVPSVHRRPGPRAPEGMWATSRDGQVFAECTTCGRTDRKHKGKGRCVKCY